MVTSVRERILQTAASAMASVAAAHGAKFLRSPLVPITREQTPALVLVPELDTVLGRFGLATERKLTISLIAVTRQAGTTGSDPLLDADALLVAAHAALMAAVTGSGLSVGIAEADTDWDIKTFEVTSAYLPARYTITYRTACADIATQG